MTERADGPGEETVSVATRFVQVRIVDRDVPSSFSQFVIMPVLQGSEWSGVAIRETGDDRETQIHSSHEDVVQALADAFQGILNLTEFSSDLTTLTLDEIEEEEEPQK